MIAWFVRRFGLVGMALVTLVLAHDLSYLASYGATYPEAMLRTGHDDRWTAAVLAVSALGLALVLAAVWQVRRLALVARAVAARPARRAERRARPAVANGQGEQGPRRAIALFAVHVADLWPRLALGGGALFVLQENIERLASGEPLPGLDVLGSASHPYPIPLILLVSLVVAAVGALFRWRAAELRTLIARATSAWRRARSAARLRSVDIVRPTLSIIGRGFAVRAPPPAAV
jgi:hypothetical protein